MLFHYLRAGMGAAFRRVLQGTAGCRAPGGLQHGQHNVSSTALLQTSHPLVWRELEVGEAAGGRTWQERGAAAAVRVLGRRWDVGRPTKPNDCALPPQPPSWMTPWSAAGGSGSPSPWPRTASTARPSAWGRPRWRWTSLSCCGTASMRRRKPVSTLQGSPAPRGSASRCCSG